MTVFIKICGLSTEASVRAATRSGADCIGLVFFPKSPRNVSLDRAEGLAAIARETPGVMVAALVVDADDDLLAAIVRRIGPDLVQLHGSETPERVAEIGRRFNVATMKAIGVREAADLGIVARYRTVADRVLLDAKPPKGGGLPGGNGVAFDWSLLESLDLDDRFMLSGGLNPKTVAAALLQTGMAGVDVSSGVETAPGVKDLGLIAEFVDAVRRQALEGEHP